MNTDDVYDILTYPNPILKKKAKNVTKVSGEIVLVIEKMCRTMYKSEGIGLAAPQVGISSRIVVIDIGTDEDQDQDNGDSVDKASVVTKINMINPVIIKFSKRMTICDEGCLSLPGVRRNIARHSIVGVTFQDEYGVEHKLTASGTLAICIQHEIDHLNGILMLDHHDEKDNQGDD